MAYINRVEVDESSYLIEPTLYVTPAKSLETNVYTAMLNSFSLVSGVVVSAKFNATNSESNSTAALNINSTGNKDIYYLNAAIPLNWLQTNTTYILVYNGTRWDIIGQFYSPMHYIWFGTCDTSASTQEKAVTIDGITNLTNGLSIRVKFLYAQTYNGTPKLNVNNLGAINVSSANQYEWPAGAIIDFVYNGSQWVILDHNHATTDYWGLTKLSSNADDDTTAATAKSVYQLKQQLNNLLNTNDAFIFKGLLDYSIASDNDTTKEYQNVPVDGYSAGWVYKVIEAGTYAGITCEVGDLVIAISDAAEGQSAINNTHWTVIQGNVDSSLFKGNNTFVDSEVLIADGVNGKVKSSGFTIQTSVPQNALFTDELVKQTALSANGEYNLIISKSVASILTSGTADEVGYDTNITVNPFTHAITATHFLGNATTATSWAQNQIAYVNLSVSGTDSTINGGQNADQVLKVSGVLNVGNGGTGSNSFGNNFLIFATTDLNNVQYLTTGQNKHYVDDNGLALNLNTLTSGYVLEVGGKVKINSHLDIVGNINPTTNNTSSLGTGGQTPLRWKSLFLGTSDTYGDAYTPVYWNNGVPAPATTIQQANFTLTTTANGVQKIGTSTNVSDNTEVVEIVVESGFSNLLSTIQWTITTDVLNNNNKQIQLTATVDGNVSGYILFKK